MPQRTNPDPRLRGVEAVVAPPSAAERKPAGRPTAHNDQVDVVFVDGRRATYLREEIDSSMLTDRDGLERLCRYGARSPISNSRLSLDPRGRVVLSLKRPLRDGRTELAFPPVEFLRRLATLIPPPRAHLTRYHGVFAPHHNFRAAVVPAAAVDETGRKPCRRFDWAALMKRVFAIDVFVCGACRGAMSMLAIIPEGDATRSILEHLGLPTQAPHPRAHPPPDRLFDDA